MVWTMFVGRQEEREVIDAFLRDTDPKTVVVRAAAGMGKTTLIQYCLEAVSAEDVEIVHSAGVRTEVHFPFAGLVELLSPLLGRLELLPEPQR